MYTTVYPILTSPGYEIKYVHGRADPNRKVLTELRSIDERTLVYFSDNPRYVIEAYVENGEGLDRAGGFAIQVSSLLPLYCECFFSNAIMHTGPRRPTRPED